MSAHGSVFSHRCLIEKRRVLFIWANVWSWNGPSPQPLPLLLPVHAYSMQSHLTFCLTVVVKHLEYHMQVFDWYCLKKAAVNSSRVGWTENLKGFQKRLDIEFEMSAETKPQLALMANFRGVAMTKFLKQLYHDSGPLIQPNSLFCDQESEHIEKTCVPTPTVNDLQIVHVTAPF